MYKCSIAGGYEIPAANWGIIQLQFVQLPAEWCQHVRRSRLGSTTAKLRFYEDQESPLIGDRCGVVSDPRISEQKKVVCSTGSKIGHVRRTDNRRYQR